MPSGGSDRRTGNGGDPTPGTARFPAAPASPAITHLLDSHPKAMEEGNPACKPDSNLVWAILVTTLCCMPLGVVAIVKAASVDSLWAAGSYAEARKAAQDAGKWAAVSAICGLVIVLCYMLYMMTIIAVAALHA